MGSNGAIGGGSNRYEPPKKKNPVVEFIKDGGITGAIARSVSAAIKNSKTKNRKSASGDVYAGESYGYNESKEKKDYKPNNFTPDIDGGNNNLNSLL